MTQQARPGCSLTRKDSTHRQRLCSNVPLSGFGEHPICPAAGEPINKVDHMSTEHGPEAKGNTLLPPQTDAPPITQ